MHILLIDDHALFREGLKFLLRSLDAALEVDEAGDCAKALKHAVARRYERSRSPSSPKARSDATAGFGS